MERNVISCYVQHFHVSSTRALQLDCIHEPRVYVHLKQGNLGKKPDMITQRNSLGAADCTGTGLVGRVTAANSSLALAIV